MPSLWRPAWRHDCNSLERGSKPHLLLSPPGRPHPDPGFFLPRESQPARANPLVRSRLMQVLAGDIGGTKTAIALVQVGPRSLAVSRWQLFPSAEFASLEDILEKFLAGERRRPAAAAFGVAGPVVAGTAKITKLPWTIDERRSAAAAGIPRVRVINDFMAAALGISYLEPRHLLSLARGRPEPGGPIALIGAGTGLGQAALVRVKRPLRASPLRGGTCRFRSPGRHRRSTGSVPPAPLRPGHARPFALGRRARPPL